MAPIYSVWLAEFAVWAATSTGDWRASNRQQLAKVDVWILVPAEL